MSTSQRARCPTLLSGASNRTTELTGIIGAGKSCFGTCTRAVDMEELYSVNIGTEMEQQRIELTRGRSS